MSSDDNQEEPMTSDVTYQSEPITSSALITVNNETTIVLPADTATVIPADIAAKVTDNTQTVITKSTRMLSYTQTVTSRQSTPTARFVDQSNLLFHLLNDSEVTGDKEDSITENISRDANTSTVTSMMLSKVIWFLERVGLKQTRIDFTVLLLHSL